MASLSLALISSFILLVGCAAQPHYSTPAADSSRASFATNAANQATTPVGTAVVVPPESPKVSDRERLDALWRQRGRTSTAIDYPIGPGDLLEINVAGVDELNNRVVRVSGEGTITLPYLEVVQAGGLTEEELRTEIHRRLEQYIYTPQVNLFVREYRSRQVAVVGAVEKPGLYNLASGNDTILDVLSLAGGMKEDAAPRLNFIPANYSERHKTEASGTMLPAGLVPKDQAFTVMKNKDEDPIGIDLNGSTPGSTQMYLSLPVRPGDVIIVPGRGEVLVEGWVEKPGSYKITPGLTILGAVAAAGGPSFPANTDSVKIIRQNDGGKTTVSVVSLERIKHGEEPDSPVQGGDIVELASSTTKLIPYGFYSFLTQVLHFGTYLP